MSEGTKQKTSKWEYCSELHITKSGKETRLTHRLVIEWIGVKVNGESCPVYYCIGCDKNFKNVVHDHSLPHMYSCVVCAISVIFDL